MAKYKCICCDYATSRLSQFTRHKLTAKHLELSNFNNRLTPKVLENGKPVESTFVCKTCNKIYKSRVGLWGHSKKCEKSGDNHSSYIAGRNQPSGLPEHVVGVGGIQNNEILSNMIVSTEYKPTEYKPTEYTPTPIEPVNSDAMRDLIKELCSSNAELKHMLLEQQNKMMELSSKIGNNNTINSNNTQINVNMFLNEYCKDAITLTKFIESVKPSFEDVMYMSDKGNVAGLTKILKTALGGLAITDRPLHCTDVKRHTTWVKEADGWQKDQEQVNLKRLCNKV